MALQTVPVDSWLESMILGGFISASQVECKSLMPGTNRSPIAQSIGHSPTTLLALEKKCSTCSFATGIPLTKHESLALQQHANKLSQTCISKILKADPYSISHDITVSYTLKQGYHPLSTLHANLDSSGWKHRGIPPWCRKSSSSATTKVHGLGWWGASAASTVDDRNPGFTSWGCFF